MRAAVRLWWLLRTTAPRRRDPGASAAFALLAWSALSGAGLWRCASADDVRDPALAGALTALAGALALTAVAAARVALRCPAGRRLPVLRSAGATRAQAGVVAALEVAEVALPGVAVAVALHLFVCAALSRAGISPTAGGLLLLAPAVACLAVAGLLVVRRVRTCTA